MGMFFSADLHLGHDKIRQYLNRPFTSVQEMDQTILNRINQKIGEKDDFYMLGDFAFGYRNPFETIQSYRNRIVCKHVHLILGNHDPHTSLYLPRQQLYPIFSSVNMALRLKVRMPDKIQIYLHHYACKVWPASHYGSFHLYGHSHGKLADDPHSLSFDAGIDCHDFWPLSLQDVCDIMAQKEWINPLDKAT